MSSRITTSWAIRKLQCLGILFVATCSIPITTKVTQSVSKQDEGVPTWADLAGNLTGMF